jgi:hypothetical protein
MKSHPSMKAMIDKCNTDFLIPDHVKSMDVHLLGNGLIEVFDVNRKWKGNLVSELMDFKVYVKVDLGFRQVSKTRYER